MIYYYSQIKSSDEEEKLHQKTVKNIYLTG